MGKNKFIYSIVTATILFIGCGNGSSGNTPTNSQEDSVAKHMAKDTITPVHHIGTRARDIEKQDFDVNSIKWEYNNFEGIQVHLDPTYMYIKFTHNTKVPNIQFFLDIDNNKDSGNHSEDGADYMVENGYLYQSTSSNGWGWKEISEVKSVIEREKSDTVAIKLSNLKNKNVVFKVNAQALGEDWKPQKMSPIDGSKSIYSKKNSINWDKITPYAKNGNKVVKIFDTPTHLFFNIEQDSFPKHTQIYLDSDNDIETGYRGRGWPDELGRDYLIEDGHLYKYTGKGSWGWEFVSMVENVRTYDKKASIIVTIPKKKFTNLGKKIRVGVQTNNATWNDTVFIAKSGISEYLLKSQNPNPKNIEISEIMASNNHTIVDADFSSFSDWIELHNKANQPIDISGYKLSNKLNDPKWTIPANTTIPANGYLLLWADKEDKKAKALHTNFKLKAKGGAVALFDKEGKSIDAFEYKKQIPDISAIKKDDKVGYMNPTPKAKNTKVYDSATLSKTPTFSKTSGFYDSVQVALSSEADIYYTTDGSIPNLHSNKYTNKISVNKTMSIRAISIEDGKFASPVVTHTYLIGEDDINMPVVAITTDDKYINDETIGLYTIGTNGITMEDCGVENPIRANFFQDWERPVHMTFFEEDKKVVLSQDAGLEISGQCSRNYDQKSLKLKADDKYGEDDFAYQIFPDKNIKKFKKIKLRNAGQDNPKAHMRDVLAQMITKGEMHINYEAYRPAIVFLNGNYWGLYNLREKKGTGYIKNNYGLSKKKIDMIVDYGGVKAGSFDEFDELLKYLKHNSLVSETNYDYIASKIDIDNYIDYTITNIYIGNYDWPGTNLLYWKEKKDGSKWQWLPHDMDFSFALFSNVGGVTTDVNFNSLKKAMEVVDTDWPNPEWSTRLFRKLLENQTFKTKFKDRATWLLDTVFASDRVNGIIDDISEKMDPQMQRQIQKWPENNNSSKEDWIKEVDEIRAFVSKRSTIVKAHINEL